MFSWILNFKSVTLVVFFLFFFSPQVRLLCWWTAPAPPPWLPAAPWSASSSIGLALSVSWVPAQTSSNATSNSTTALCRCLSEGAFLLTLTSPPPAAPSPPLLLSFQTQGSTSAFLFLLVFFFFAFCHLLLISVPPFPLLISHTNHFIVPTGHAAVTVFVFLLFFFLSHSPALVPAAVRYLVGTVTPHVTYVIYIYLLIKLLFFSIRSGRSERFSDWWDRQSDFTLRFQ